MEFINYTPKKRRPGLLKMDPKIRADLNKKAISAAVSYFKESGTNLFDNETQDKIYSLISLLLEEKKIKERKQFEYRDWRVLILPEYHNSYNMTTKTWENSYKAIQIHFTPLIKCSDSDSTFKQVCLSYCYRRKSMYMYCKYRRATSKHKRNLRSFKRCLCGMLQYMFKAKTPEDIYSFLGEFEEILIECI